MNEKVVGYILLILGLIIICVAGVSVYLVFTKQAQPVQLFNFAPISFDAGQLVGQSAKPTELISASMINDSSNIFAHLFLMGFVVSIGYKIANLGVNLVRTIEVKLRAKDTAIDTSKIVK